MWSILVVPILWLVGGYGIWIGLHSPTEYGGLVFMAGSLAIFYSIGVIIQIIIEVKRLQRDDKGNGLD